jgi:hypothetical protein
MHDHSMRLFTRKELREELARASVAQWVQLGAENFLRLVRQSGAQTDLPPDCAHIALPRDDYCLLLKQAINALRLQLIK